MEKSRHSVKRQNYQMVCQNCGSIFYSNRCTARYCCSACKAMFARRALGEVSGEVVNGEYGRKFLKAECKPYHSKKYAALVAERKEQQEIANERAIKEKERQEKANRENAMLQLGGAVLAKGIEHIFMPSKK